MNPHPSPIPAPAGALREEVVGAHVPPTRDARDALARAADEFVAGGAVVPPFSFPELAQHTESFLRARGIDRAYLPYAAVLLSNAAWQRPLSAVPFDRRLLLLPQCLREKANCRGTMDDLGLLCARCGKCLIDSLTHAAHELGYTVLVAEGTPVVVELIRSGRIQGIVGVSCLDSLERIFPLMQTAAVPAVAIPLLRDGCNATAVDADCVFAALRRHEPGGAFLDVPAVQREVEQWFTPAGLAEVLGPLDGPTDELARGWLLEAGKRWRPLLTACAYAAMTGSPSAALPADVRRLAVAVECFHKASLVRDDIEDGNFLRYGRQTLHERCGVPIALNVGDFLLGEGYRLIGECGLGGEVRSRLLQAAARAHRELCIGQGGELSWLRDFRPLSAADVLEIFRRKTAPAFAGALRFGAICAGASDALLAVLDTYSEHLGIAFQIQDDLADFEAESPATAPGGPRPSIVLALAHQSATGAERARIEEIWRTGAPCSCGVPCSCESSSMGMVSTTGPYPPADGAVAWRPGGSSARQAADDLLRLHLDKAVASLGAIHIAGLKRLLRQVLGSIFPDVLLRDPGVFPK
jgi:geranylgeranyl diphosphate synthase, type II